MKTNKEMIADLAATRAVLAAALATLTTKASTEGRTMDSAEAEEFDTKSDEIDAIDADIKRYERLEKSMVATARPVDGKPTSSAASNARDPSNTLQLRQAKNDDPKTKGLEFVRYAMALVAAKGDPQRALAIARNKMPNEGRVLKVLEAQCNSGQRMGEVLKANVAAGTTTDATWASPLLDYQVFAGDFIEYLRPQTILGKFGTPGIPSLRAIPFNVHIKGQTSGGQGYWVGQGAAKPVTKFDFNDTYAPWAKVAAIAVLTEELIRFSSPSAEMLVRTALADALRERLDVDFIDPAKAAVANVSPASVTNGVTPIISSGNTADNVRADLRALWAQFIQARNPPTTAVYIMSATTALALSLMVNALGQPEFLGITMNGGTFGGVPVIVSEYADAAAGSSGGTVVLVNASDIYLADDGDFAIDASREASLEMDSSPSGNSGTGTEAQLVSMFQTNSVALRGERYVYWSKRRNSAVAYITGVAWGQ